MPLILINNFLTFIEAGSNSFLTLSTNRYLPPIKIRTLRIRKYTDLPVCERTGSKCCGLYYSLTAKKKKKKKILAADKKTILITA